MKAFLRKRTRGNPLHPVHPANPAQATSRMRNGKQHGMKSKGVLILVVLLSPCTAQEVRPGPAEHSSGGQVLRLYLPRTAVTEKDRLTLGDVAVIHSGDSALAARAAALALGRAPWPAETLALSRMTILSRLASHGIPSRTIRFSGAAKVSVERKTKVVSAEQIARLAAEFVRQAEAAGDDGTTLELTGTVREMVLAAAAKVELKVRPARAQPAGHVAVEVVARRGKQELASVRVLFKRLYAHKVAVAVKEIKAGDPITPANARIETVNSPRPQTGWQSPYGLVATKRLRPGAQIDLASLSESGRSPAAKAAALTRLKRNDRVIIRVRGPGFVIMALGVVLEDGKVGDTVQVRNVDTQRVITGTIAPDGAVEPTMR